MMPDLDVLAALDWHTIGCQCDAYDCTKRGGCPNQATCRVELHAFDHCNQTLTQDGDTLDPFGNYVFLLCPHCLDDLAQIVDLYVGRLNAYGRKTCATCGAPVAELSDVIREVTPL